MIILGILDGRKKFGFIPGMLVLPESPIKNEPSVKFPPALTDSGALTYSEGPDKDECSLRRYASLDWIVRETEDGLWRLTGHVLVMDMEHKRASSPMARTCTSVAKQESRRS